MGAGILSTSILQLFDASKYHNKATSIEIHFRLNVCFITEISFWVGGSDITSEGTWIWEDGKPMNMTYFLTGQPTGGNTKNCAALSSTNNGFLLSENVCTLSKEFICEKA